MSFNILVLHYKYLIITFLNHCKYFINKKKCNSMQNIVGKLNIYKYLKFNLILISYNHDILIIETYLIFILLNP